MKYIAFCKCEDWYGAYGARESGFDSQAAYANLDALVKDLAEFYYDAKGRDFAIVVCETFEHVVEYVSNDDALYAEGNFAKGLFCYDMETWRAIVDKFQVVYPTVVDARKAKEAIRQQELDRVRAEERRKNFLELKKEFGE